MTANAQVEIVDHPLVQHKLTLLRDKNTGSSQFRQMVKELSLLLAYEVCRDLPIEQVDIDNMGKERAENSVRQSAQDLGLGSIDLVLIHWPGKFIKRGDPDNDRTNRQLREETWAALEKLRHEGLVKSIGVSNFSERHLKELLSYGKPSVNQFECREWRRLNQPRAAAHLPLPLHLPLRPHQHPYQHPHPH